MSGRPKYPPKGPASKWVTTVANMGVDDTARSCLDELAKAEAALARIKGVFRREWPHVDEPIKALLPLRKALETMRDGR